MWFSAMEGPMDVESKPGDKILSNVGYECKQSLLKRADGSAFFKLGRIYITCFSFLSSRLKKSNSLHPPKIAQCVDVMRCDVSMCV